MSSVNNAISDAGIVPVIKLDNAANAVPLAKALYSGGIAVAEITFRTAAAEESIARIAVEVPEVLVGAGTVLNSDQVDRAAKAGAKFIVSPGFSKEVVKHALDLGLAVYPGCLTPSEIMAAIDFRLDTVKFFPAGNYGGLSTIKALSAAFGAIKFMPTGGINASNLADYLRFDKIIACGGSWMVKPDYAETTRLCAEARDIVREARK